MVTRSIFRSRTFWIVGIAGLGGIAPDIGHFLNLVTGGKVDWLYGHHLWFWAVWTFSSLAGLGAALVLKQIKSALRARCVAAPSVEYTPQHIKA